MATSELCHVQICPCFSTRTLSFFLKFSSSDLRDRKKHIFYDVKPESLSPIEIGTWSILFFLSLLKLTPRNSVKSLLNSSLPAKTHTYNMYMYVYVLYLNTKPVLYAKYTHPRESSTLNLRALKKYRLATYTLFVGTLIWVQPPPHRFQSLLEHDNCCVFILKHN